MPSFQQIAKAFDDATVIIPVTPPATPSLNNPTDMSANSMKVAWSAISVAEGYKLDVSLNAGFTSFLTGYQNLNVGSALNYTITGLSPSTTYYARIRAYNDNGDSGYSNVVTAATITSGQVGSIAFAGISLDGANQLSWRAPAGATGYQVQKYISNAWTTLTTISGTQYADNALTNGEPNTYRILAIGTSAQSDPLVITPEINSLGVNTISAPVGLSGFCVASSKNWILWQKGDTMDRLSYVIEWKVGNLGTWNILTTINPVLCDKGVFTSADLDEKRKVESQRYFEHNFSGLSGTLYYRIKATYGNGIIESAYSSELQVVIQGSYVDSTLANLKATYDSGSRVLGDAVRITSTATLSTANDITLKQGVSIVAAPNVTATVEYTGQMQYSWNKAYLSYHPSSQISLGLEVSGLVIDAGEYIGRAGVSITNCSNIVFKNLLIKRTFWQGIGISGTTSGGGGNNVLLHGCSFLNAGYGPPESGDTWANEGNSFIGMTTLRGNTKNIQIYACIYNTVDNSTGRTNHKRGYGIKALINYIDTNGGDYYNLIQDLLVWNCFFTMGNRLWQGSSPQFSIEIWALESILCTVFNNSFENQLSLEKRNTVNGSSRFNFRVVQNYLHTIYKASIEYSNHKIWAQNNVIDHRDATGGEEIFGDYNKPSSGYYTTNGGLVEGNLILAHNTPILFTSRNLTNGLTIRNNTVIWNAGIYAVVNLRTYDNGSAVNIPTNMKIQNNVFRIVTSQTNFLVRISTDTAGGGFLSYGSGPIAGQSTASIDIQGNIMSNPVQLLPSGGGANTKNSFGVAPQFATGGSTYREQYKPLAGGNLVDTGEKIGKAYSGLFPDRGYYESIIASN